MRGIRKEIIDKSDSYINRVAGTDTIIKKTEIAVDEMRVKEKTDMVRLHFALATNSGALSLRRDISSEVSCAVICVRETSSGILFPSSNVKKSK